MNSSDFGDRLGLLRESCVAKYGRLSEITQALEEGDQLIENVRKSFPDEVATCNMRVQLAERQSNNAFILERIESGSKKQMSIQHKMDEIKTDLEVHMERYKTLAEKVSTERQQLAVHHEIAMDTLNMIYEQYLMSNEEVFTLVNLIKDVENKSRTNNRIDWLKKIIRATQIQLKENESCLAYIENEHTTLTNGIASRRKG